MAEDAVESAGAKAPAITISIQQFIASLEVLCHQTIDVSRFIPNLARDHAADRHAHRRRRFAIALCASDAVITNVDFSRTK
jgi:hypothetical protein